MHKKHHEPNESPKPKPTKPIVYDEPETEEVDDAGVDDGSADDDDIETPPKGPGNP